MPIDYEKEKLTPGQRIKLLANAEEGWDEEFGEVLEYEGNGLYCVSVDEKYRVQGDLDDGIREVLHDYIEKV